MKTLQLTDDELKFLRTALVTAHALVHEDPHGIAMGIFILQHEKTLTCAEVNMLQDRMTTLAAEDVTGDAEITGVALMSKDGLLLMKPVDPSVN